MTQLASIGIATLELDVLSDTSIAACATKVQSLDILVNNAGAGYDMPISDMSITEGKKIFDLNFWAYIAVTQVFLPHLLASKGMVVNHTSVLSVAALPFQAPYNASKAALAMFSNTLRLELYPFDVSVVDLKSGVVRSNFLVNLHKGEEPSIPKGSIYEPAQETVIKVLKAEEFEAKAMPADKWAQLVVHELVKTNPPEQIWKGADAFIVWLGTILPNKWLDKMVRKIGGIDAVRQQIQKS